MLYESYTDYLLFRRPTGFLPFLSKFDLILCEVCGSYGTHVACKGLLQSGSSLVCPICIDDTGMEKNLRGELSAHGRLGRCSGVVCSYFSMISLFTFSEPPFSVANAVLSFDFMFVQSALKTITIDYYSTGTAFNSLHCYLRSFSVTTRSTTSNTPERDSQRRRSHTNDSDCEDRLVFWSGQRSPTSISTRSNVDTDRSQSSPFNRNFGAVLVLESASLSHESLFNTRLRRGNSSEQAVEYVSVENVLDSDGLDQSGISLRSRNRSRSRLRRTDYSEYRNSRSCANDDDVQGHRSGLRCSSISNFDSNRSSVSNPHLDSVTQGHRSGLRSYSISNSGSSGSFGDSHLKCANRYIRLMHCDLNGKKWTD